MFDIVSESNRMRARHGTCSGSGMISGSVKRRVRNGPTSGTVAGPPMLNMTMPVLLRQMRIGMSECQWIP